MNAAPIIVPAFSEAARQAVRLALHGRNTKPERLFSLSLLYGAIEECARFTMSVPLEERTEALARAVALTIHTATATPAQSALQAKQFGEIVNVYLEILARDPACTRSPEEGAQ